MKDQVTMGETFPNELLTIRMGPQASCKGQQPVQDLINAPIKEIVAYASAHRILSGPQFISSPQAPSNSHPPSLSPP